MIGPAAGGTVGGGPIGVVRVSSLQIFQHSQHALLGRNGQGRLGGRGHAGIWLAALDLNHPVPVDIEAHGPPNIPQSHIVAATDQVGGHGRLLAVDVKCLVAGVGAQTGFCRRMASAEQSHAQHNPGQQG